MLLVLLTHILFVIHTHLSSIALMSQPRSEGTEAAAKTIHNCYHGNWNQSEMNTEVDLASHLYTLCHMKYTGVYIQLSIQFDSGFAYIIA